MLTGKSRFPVRELVLFGWMPSFLKKVVYRLRGYRIGKGVSLGFGAVIVGKDVEVGDHTSIGFLTVIRGKSIRIGRYVEIGSATIFDTPHLELGDGTKVNEQVFVGGLQFPDSRLVVGRNCQIMQMTFINPTRSITIGDDTGIGGDCLLFGHTSWLSRFEGYPVEFESIEIGKSVSIAWRVFLLAGSKVGDGAVVGANSLVRGSIPERCLALGFPARVVSREPDFPKPVPDEEKDNLLGGMILELMQMLRDEGYRCETKGDVHLVEEVKGSGLFTRKGRWTLGVYRGVKAEPTQADAAGCDVFLSLWAIPRELRKSLMERGVVWLDLEKKERSDAGSPLGDEVAQHLRRYGVRFFRVQPAELGLKK
jgi:acetyltransferase-like isoleucine patch superfamily enzyme